MDHKLFAHQQSGVTPTSMTNVKIVRKKQKNVTLCDATPPSKSFPTPYINE